MRDVRDKIGFQTGQRHLFADDVFGERQAANYQQRKDSQDQKTAMHPGLAEGLYAGALKFDTQRQSAKDVVELARYLGFAFVPTARNGERFHFPPALVLRRIDHYGNLVSALVTRLLVNDLFEHSRKETLFQITGIEGDSAQYYSVV